jgi:hypothetical protein
MRCPAGTAAPTPTPIVTEDVVALEFFELFTLIEKPANDGRAHFSLPAIVAVIVLSDRVNQVGRIPGTVLIDVSAGEGVGIRGVHREQKRPLLDRPAVVPAANFTVDLLK